MERDRTLLDVLTETVTRSEVWFFCGQEDMPIDDLTPALELTMMKLYERAFKQGFNHGVDHAVVGIIEGLSDGVQFAADSLKVNL